MRWYRRAADQGDADAQVNLGLMYVKGEGVLQDYVQAHKWLNIAASRIVKPARGRETVIRIRERIESKMTVAQLAEAQRLAREWHPEQGPVASDQGPVARN